MVDSGRQPMTGRDGTPLEEVHVGRYLDEEGVPTPDAHQDHNELVLLHEHLQRLLPGWQPLKDLRTGGFGPWLVIPGWGRSDRFRNLALVSVDEQGNVRDRYHPHLATLQVRLCNPDGQTRIVHIRRTSLDDAGRPLSSGGKPVYEPHRPRTSYVVSVDGQPLGGAMTIVKESVAADGKAARDRATGQPRLEPGRCPITVYSAQVADDDAPTERPHTAAVLVFTRAKLPDRRVGAGTLGRSVLLHPGTCLARDRRGALVDGQFTGPTPSPDTVPPVAVDPSASAGGRPIATRRAPLGPRLTDWSGGFTLQQMLVSQAA